MSGWKKLASAAAATSEILPEATSFDGSNDYLNRTSTLSGATANKTITASYWFYERKPISGNPSYGIFSGIEGFNSFSFNMYHNGDDIEFYGAVDNSGIDFGWTLSRRNSLKGQWNHVCFSFDLSDSSKRHVYINGEDYSTTVTWDAYQNANMNWANCPKWSIAATSYSYATKLKGRLAHVFIDNSYIDLSVSSNLEKFITTDLKPADGQSALSPLIYFPMTDYATAGTNEGTGGSFTTNGTLAQATRGPNQENCVATLFQTSDRMYSYSNTLSNSSYFLTSFTLNTESISGSGYVLFHGRIQIVLETSYSPGRLRVNIANTAGDSIFEGELRYRPLGKQNHYTFAYDASAATYQLYENGVSIAFDDVGTQTTGTIDYEDSTYYAIGDGSNNRSAIGEFYLDNADIDLSADNPFWDSDANKPKPLRQVLDETGNTPYIAMPLNALDPELNLGTGSQGSASSDPYYSYRGGSEFWARSIEQTAIGGGGSSVNYLSLTNPLTSSEAELTIVVAAKTLDTTINSDSAIVEIGNTGNGLVGSSSETLKFQIDNSNSMESSTLFNVEDWYVFGASLDTNQTLAEVYNLVSGSLLDNDTANFGSPQDLSGGTIRILAGDVYNQWKGDVGFVYITTDYIDFSQESNRHLFVEQLGYPKDLTAAIEAGDIPTPLVYMKFDDPSDLGANSGSGGDFTVNGTVSIGSDVNPA